MKKKKKKTQFDLDAALGETDSGEVGDASNLDGANEIDENFENLGKKKKKKKKPFNLDDLEQNLPIDKDEKKEDGVNEGAGDDGANVEDDYDLDVDFSKTKKKKKKKKELEELVADLAEENQQAIAANGKYIIQISIIINKNSTKL